MPKLSSNSETIAKEVKDRFGTPSLVYRGSVMSVNENGSDLRPKEFLGFEGTSSTFLVRNGEDGEYEVCSVEAIEAPEVRRNKLKIKGRFKLVECSPCVGNLINEEEED